MESMEKLWRMGFRKWAFWKIVSSTVAAEAAFSAALLAGASFIKS